MTDQSLSLAAVNVGLLDAIAATPPEGIKSLAEAAAIHPNHANRKLESLIENGLIVRTGEKSWDVELTEAGRRARAAIEVYRTGVAPEGGSRMIPFNRIVAWPKQPRKAFVQKTIEDLGHSIAMSGVIEPIMVRPVAGGDFQVVMGERRRRACVWAVAENLVAADFCIPCEVRELADDEAEDLAAIENIQREDMHWLDLADYFRRQMDERRRSGPALERMFGRKWSARKIQDYAKIARELADDLKVKAYLPEKLDEGTEKERPNPDCLTYTRARDLVGEKKERPALDLTPRVACALIEVIDAGLHQRGITQWAPGETIVTRYGSPPNGGPLAKLQEMKLLAFGFDDRKVVSRTMLGEDIVRWLRQQGYDASPATALYRLRSAASTEMQARELEISGGWLTTELNTRTPSAAPPAAPSDPESGAEGLMGQRGEQGAQAPGSTPPTDRTEEPQASPHALPEGSPATAAAPDASSGAAPAPPLLPPMLEIVVVEIAHRLGRDARKSAAGAWGVTVLADYYKDTRANQLVQIWRMMGLHPAGNITLAVQTDVARAFLAENYGLEPEAEGYTTVGDALLTQAQAALMGREPPEGQRYWTAFLNPAQPEAAPPAQAPEAPAHAVRDTHPGRDQFSQDILRISAESRAWTSLAAAAEGAQAFLSGLRAKSKAPKAEDVDAQVRRLEAALDGVKPYRSEPHAEAPDGARA